MNIGQDQIGAIPHRQGHGLCPGAGIAGDTVAKAPHDINDIQRDDRFILDHHHGARDRRFHFFRGHADQQNHVIRVQIHDGGDLLDREPLDHMQQQRLARIRGKCGHMLLRPRR